MRTEYPGVDWLLDCEPRIVQLEATARSYTGYAYREHKNDPMPGSPRPLKHAGYPAEGWGHLLDMRLGKSPLLLNEFQLFRRDHDLRRLVIFSPNQYKTSWKLEAQKFGVELPVHVYETQQRSKARDFINKNSEFVLVINYEALQHKSNLPIIEDAIDDGTLLGADESVIIKNRQSIMTKNALHMSKQAAAVRILTGKPTPQGVHDLYSQMRFIRKLDGINFFQFRNTFAKMGGFQAKQVVGVKNEDKLREWAKDWYFFARRVDWGTSLEPNYEIVDVGMNTEQIQHYNEMENEFITWLSEGQEITADQAITKHIKLQQISSGFAIDEYGNTNQITPIEKVPKFVELKDRLDNYIRGKCIIIAHFNSTIDALVEALEPYNPTVIRGTMHMKKDGRSVDEEKRRFNEDTSCRVLIGQSQAIKYGHTLRGSADDPCLDTIYFENSYSLDDRAQSEQRNQGEGQLAAINIQDLCSSQVEKRVIAALQRKEQIASVIMGYYKE
jgi:hypothetical protein